MANPIVTIEMENGDIMKAELYPEVAPNTVNNFVSLVKKGYYDGLIFHRVINGFMIQGGCPDGTGMGGPGYSIKGEFAQNGFANELAHTEGVLSMAKNIFVTITGFKHYYGLEPFKIGNLIRCIKEPSNPYDSDAIRAFLPYIGKVGYIANSPQTKAGGTESASRIYERVPKRFYVRVLFTTCTKIICRVEFGDMSDLNAELESQTEDKWDDWDDEDDEIQF